MKYAFFDQFMELTAGTTNAWAFDNIKSGSHVLEIGSSVGYLTKHLKEEKNCQVDIVEIDGDAGKIATQFAQNAYIGVQGDLDNDCLKSIGPAGGYDYIVILDVLEHLRSPEKVVKEFRRLLKQDGKLIVSVPNIAHNAVLINLFNNQFKYTELGLLDRTHITFFTYGSIIRILQDAGFSAEQFEARCKSISETEIPVTYEQLPRDMRSFFRCRPYGDAYQFLLVLHPRKDSDDIGKLVPDYPENLELRSSLYYSQFESDEFDELHRIDRRVNLGKNEIDFPIIPGQTFFQIGPTGHNCVLRNLLIRVESPDGEVSEIDDYEGNGITFGNDCIAFTGTTSGYLKFHTVYPPKRVLLSFELLACDQDALDILDAPIRTLPQLHDELVKVYGEKGTLQQDYQEAVREKQQLDVTVQQLSIEEQAIKEELLQVQNERGTLAEFLQEAQTEKDDLKKSLSQTREEKAALETSLRQIQEEKTTLETTLHEVQTQKYGLERTVSRLNQILIEMLEEKSSLEDEYRETSWRLYKEMHRGLFKRKK